MLRNGISPLRDFMSLREGMDRLFEDRWVSPGNWLTWASVGTNFLPLDMYETADDVVVRAMIPGVRADAIEIQFRMELGSVGIGADPECLHRAVG